MLRDGVAGKEVDVPGLTRATCEESLWVAQQVTVFEKEFHGLRCGKHGRYVSGVGMDESKAMPSRVDALLGVRHRGLQKRPELVGKRCDLFRVLS